MKLEKFMIIEDCLLEGNINHPFLDKIIKDIFDENGKESFNFIISSELIKILLEKSFKTSSKTSKTTFLSEFFFLAFRLKILTERTPINLAILEFISTVAFSKLKLILSTLDNSENVKTCLINSISSIVNDCYCTFTEDQLKYLKDVLNFNNRDISV